MSDLTPGFKMLLMGPSGSGKTTSLKTIPEDIEVFAIFTEPRFDVLGRDILDKIHWRYIAPGAMKWDVLSQAARLVNTMGADALQKLQSISGSDYTQLIQFLNLCNNFIDQRGEQFGDVSTWGTNRLLWIDGLTGLNYMSRRLKVGIKPTLTQPEWGICMSMLKDVLDTLVTGLFCHLVVVAHVEREVDEVTGASRVMVSTLGRKLAPIIPTNFGDVVLAKKLNDGFWWSTAEPDTDLKPCYLPLSSKIPASFSPLLDEWKRRGGVLTDTTPPMWAGKEK